MTEFTMKIAGRVAAVRTIFPGTRDYCRDYLCDGEPDFTIDISAADIAFEGEKSAREAQLEGIPVRNFSDAYLETVAVQRKLAERLFAWDTLLFHGSVVAVEGQAYLFTAKSGTGKSTHTRLWRELLDSRAVMINDDKPFLTIREDQVLLCGSPWSGKHGLDTNLTVPLEGICILHRGTENAIAPLSPNQALPRLLHECYCPMDPAKAPRLRALAEALANSVPLWQMYCNKEPQAAEVAFAAMSAGRHSQCPID